MREVENYYLNKEEPVKGCLLALRIIILEQNSNIHETIKWGIPCFTYKKKMFCFLNIDKRTGEPYILFVDGKHLPYPELEQGTRSRMKIFRVDSRKDLTHKTIAFLLSKALDLY